MAKTAYKIPESLDKSRLDTEITLTTRKGDVVGRPMQIKVIMTLLLGVVFTWWLMMNTFMTKSGFLFSLRLLLGACVLGLIFLIVWPDATGESKMSLIPALVNYMDPKSRKVLVRRSQPANNFIHASGIAQVYPKQGLIKFTDGSLGYAYRVVGNASVLLFDEDRDMILDRVDNFYRKMKPEYQMLYLTAKEPQHVRVQLDSLKSRYQNLDVKDKDLTAIANMDYCILHDDVGQKFRSIHQYLILKASNPESLTLAKNMLLAECNSSTAMFKQAGALFDNDLINMLASVYQGKESV